MIKLENKDKIKEIMKSHYDAIDVLKVADHSIQEKAKIIHKELQPIYKKLKEENLLPEEIDLQKFMTIGIAMLEKCFNEAMFTTHFSGFF